MQIFDPQKHKNSALAELSAQMPAECREQIEQLLIQIPQMSPYDLLGMSKYDPRIPNFGIIAHQQADDLSEFISNNFSKSSRNRLKDGDTGLGVFAISSLNRKAVTTLIKQAAAILGDAELRKRYDRDAGVEFARTPSCRDPYDVLGIAREMLENLGPARASTIENCKTRRQMQLKLATELALAEEIALGLADTGEQERYLHGDRRRLSDEEFTTASEHVAQAARQLLTGETSETAQAQPNLLPDDDNIWGHFKLAGDKFFEGARHVADGIQVGVERAVPRVEKTLDSVTKLLDRLENELIKRL